MKFITSLLTVSLIFLLGINAEAAREKPTPEERKARFKAKMEAKKAAKEAGGEAENAAPAKKKPAAVFVKSGATTQGNLRMEVVTCPADVAAGLKGINETFLLYHPIKKTSNKDPLIMFLHGMGGKGKDILKNKWSKEVKLFLTPENSKYGTKILVPHGKEGWDPGSLNKMLDYILKTNDDIDVNRIYCVGYSMGGKGTWEMAMTSHDRLAAAVPVAFIPDLSNIKDLVNLPIWAMVGTKDSKPRVAGVPEMVEKLKSLGSKVVNISVFEGANHATTDDLMYQEAGLFDWIFDQSLEKR